MLDPNGDTTFPIFILEFATILIKPISLSNRLEAASIFLKRQLVLSYTRLLFPDHKYHPPPSYQIEQSLLGLRS